MRKIAIFILSVLSLSVISGCESKEGDYETLATVKVVSSDLVFQPSGGTGTVMFTASGSVTVESSRPWCTASVNGGSITVNVEKYDGYDNRYADIVIKSGDYSTKVTATSTVSISPCRKPRISTTCLMSTDRSPYS